jgi:hypothetical protein
LCENQRLVFRPTHRRASTLDLRSLTGKGADSGLSEALLVKTFHVAGKCAQILPVTLKSRVVTKTCHEDGAFLVG